MNRLSVLYRRGGLLVVLAFIFSFSFASTTSAQNADLSIVKAATSPTAAAGTDVTYDLAVSNISGQDSTPTNTLSDTLPANMTFVSETHPIGWNCVTPAVGSGGTITCTYDSPIPDEGSFTFNFVFHLDAGVSNGTVITNTATISHQGSDPFSPNNSSNAMVTVGAAPPPALQVHDVLISEFRLSGPGGNSDEYIEFYCNRDTDCNLGGSFIRAYDPSLRAGDPDPTVGDFSYSFPPNTIIPARQYLLVADLGQYSLSVYAFPDFNVNNPLYPDFFVDNEGIQLIGAGEPLPLDSVGFIGGGNEGQYIEGTGLQRATSRPAVQYAYVRRRETGVPTDTDNNANDFVLVSVTGALHPGITAAPVLGAPGPQSLTSPKSYDNTQVTGSLVEPAGDSQTPPNRVRTGSGDSGTLSIRRSIKNNTSEELGYIRFRVIDIDTLNSPNPGGSRADLRLVTSGTAETFMNSQGRTVTIRGTILENDVAPEPVQLLGGGLNSTVRASLPEDDLLRVEGDSIRLPPGEELVAGETLDVQFLLNVVRAGNYRFYVFVEASPGGIILDAPSPTVRRMINLKRAAQARAPSGKKPKSSGPIFPTKSTNGATSPTMFWITRPVFLAPKASTPSSVRRSKRKVRIRRRSSAALRAKAEEKNKGERPVVQN